MCLSLSCKRASMGFFGGGCCGRTNGSGSVRMAVRASALCADRITLTSASASLWVSPWSTMASSRLLCSPKLKAHKACERVMLRRPAARLLMASSHNLRANNSLQATQDFFLPSNEAMVLGPNSKSCRNDRTTLASSQALSVLLGLLAHSMAHRASCSEPMRSTTTGTCSAPWSR